MGTKYCVIGDQANNKALNRTWFDTPEEATVHGKKLVREGVKQAEARGYDQAQTFKPKRLYIVQVVGVVGTVEPQVEYHNAEDYFKLTGGEI